MSRDILKELIDESNNCRIVAFYKNGGIAITKNNAYAYSGIPSRMADAIERLVDNDDFIREVVMSNDGKWLIIQNNRGFVSDNLPDDLLEALHELSGNREIIKTVAFNEDDDWIVVTNRHYIASNPRLQRWVRDGHEEYGAIEDIYMSGDAIVACFESGYRYLNAPQKLKEALKECKYSIEQCSFNVMSGCYFFSGDQGRKFCYYM